jgi:hypothetical protein
LGRPVLIGQHAERSAELLEFAREDRLPAADIDMLASIQFRGEPPRTAARWRFIYEAIKNSEGIDRSPLRSQPNSSQAIRPHSGDASPQTPAT